MKVSFQFINSDQLTSQFSSCWRLCLDNL